MIECTLSALSVPHLRLSFATGAPHVRRGHVLVGIYGVTDWERLTSLKEAATLESALREPLPSRSRPRSVLELPAHGEEPALALLTSTRGTVLRYGPDAEDQVSLDPATIRVVADVLALCIHVGVSEAPEAGR